MQGVQRKGCPLTGKKKRIENEKHADIKQEKKAIHDTENKK